MADIHYSVKDKQVVGDLPENSTDSIYNFLFDFSNSDGHFSQSFSLTATITQEKKEELNFVFSTDSATTGIVFAGNGISTIPIHETMTQNQYNNLANIDEVKVYFITDDFVTVNNMNPNIISNTTKLSAIHDAINLIQEINNILSQSSD